MGLGDETELAIFVRDEDGVVAGIGGWTWGDCCELQSLWVHPSLRGRGLATRLIAAAEAEAAARGCAKTIHFTNAFQARALMSRPGTSSWVASKDSHQVPTSSGTANTCNPPALLTTREHDRYESAHVVGVNGTVDLDGAYVSVS